MKYIGLFPAIMLAACTAMTPEESVTTQVNRTMHYLPDTPGHDVWDASCHPAGDCEDFALCKASHLLAQGYKPKDLELVVVKRIYKNDTHAILIVKGHILLDQTNNQAIEATLADLSIRYKWIYSCNLSGLIGKPKMGGVSYSPDLTHYPKCAGAIKDLNIDNSSQG